MMKLRSIIIKIHPRPYTILIKSASWYTHTTIFFNVYIYISKRKINP